MTSVRWDALPSVVRDRFLRAVAGDGLDAPLLFIPSIEKPSRPARLALVLVAFFATLSSWLPGFGEPQNDAALTSGWACPLLALAAVGYAVGAFVAEEVSRPAFGLNAGTYLFVTHTVQVAGGELIVRRHDELAEFDAEPVPGGIVILLKFPTEVVRLTVGRSPDIERRLAACASILRAAALARRRADWEWLAARSPIGDVDSAGSAPAAFRSAMSGLVRAVCVAGGAALALMLTPVRTLASDVAVVNAISEHPSSAAWRWYIERGGARVEDARTAWLPAVQKAEDDTAFQTAVTSGTSRAFRDYLLTFSVHADQVRRKELPEAVLREAISSGSISKLRGFQTEFSAAEHGVYRQDAVREVSALYADAAVKLNSHLPPEDRDLRRYFERLFAWLATSPDGRVDVLFSPPATEGLAGIDADFRRAHASRCDSVASVETYFGASPLADSETKVFEGLKRSFRSVVSREALSLVRGETTGAERPVIRVAYTIASSGLAFVRDEGLSSLHADQCFVGIRIKFDIRMSIPGEKTRYAFSVNVLPPDRFQVSRETDRWRPRRSAGEADRLYDVMTALAFERLADSVRTRLFDPSSSAYDQMFDMSDSVSR